MKTSTLESKTVRPGLMGYSFYASDRHPKSYSQSKVVKRHGKSHTILAVLAVLLIAGFAAYALKPGHKVAPVAAKTTVTSSKKTTMTPPKKAAAVAATPPVQATNYCSGNTLANFVKVSISQRHMWACQGETTVYDSPVVTGIEYLAADRTPLGTYHVYGKYTDLTLRGSDSTGSWSDPVSYWMPFLDNQYGQYGFHDATWRDNNAFGNIDPNSSDASHGCVELPLSTAAWLYNWAPVDTTVTITS